MTIHTHWNKSTFCLVPRVSKRNKNEGQDRKEEEGWHLIMSKVTFCSSLFKMPSCILTMSKRALHVMCKLLYLVVSVRNEQSLSDQCWDRRLRYLRDMSHVWLTYTFLSFCTVCEVLASLCVSVSHWAVAGEMSRKKSVYVWAIKQ